MTLNNFKKRFLTSLVLFLLIFLMIKQNLFLIYFLILLSVLSILEFMNILKRITKVYYLLIIANVFFVSYLLFFSTIFYLISNIPHLKVLLYSFLICCVASDLGGYVFGKIFKGPKLTKISPKKTISGSLGSLIMSCILLSIMMFYFFNLLSIKILLIGLIISTSCQIGDLFFSYMKRKANLKDTGNFLPGHGGVLDRIDGILFGIPTGFLSINLFF
jgi:phosphatidate cytidylyltransferase